MFWIFTPDQFGDFVDTDGNRYTAHGGNAFHTPDGGLNTGLPEADTAEEAGEELGYLYAPIPQPETPEDISNTQPEI